MLSYKELIISIIIISSYINIVVGNINNDEKINLNNFLLPLGINELDCGTINMECDNTIFSCENGRVVEIYIPYELCPDRVGKIENVASLAKLTKLSILGGTINGGIPDELFQLPELVELQLMYNNMNTQIPETMFDSETIEKIEIIYNLVGEIPSNIASNNNALRILILNNNELTGTIPETLTSYSLETLFLTNNKLKGKIEVDANRGIYPELYNLGLHNNCFDECPDVKLPPLNRDISNNPFERYSCSLNYQNFDIMKCYLELNDYYNTFTLIDNPLHLMSSGDVILNKNFEVLTDTIINHNVILNTPDFHYFYNRGSNGLLKIDGNIIINLSDDDYQELQSGVLKNILFHDGFGFDTLDLQRKQVYVIYNSNPVDNLKIIFTADNEQLRIEYLLAKNICEYVNCIEDTFEIIGDELIEIKENIIILSGTKIQLTNPTTLPKIIAKNDSHIAIEGGIIEIIFDDDTLLNNIIDNSENSKISLIEGSYRGHFDTSSVTYPDNLCGNITIDLSYEVNLLIQFNLDKTECTDKKWVIILIIVLSSIIGVLLLLFIITLFVKPIRYFIFPFRKRVEIEKRNDNVKEKFSKIYQNKSKINPLSVV